MAKLLTTLRTHWKKSIFFSLAGAYGTHWAQLKYRENQLMTRFCQEASKYGQMPHHLDQPLYNVTVILNPAASGGQGRQKFENYCAPILNCAGLRVSVVRTEGIGEAKRLMEIMSEANAVLVAGGDGTLMETVSGLFKRADADTYGMAVPVGVLPVGRTNSMAQNLFPNAARNGLSEVELLANAAMAVVKQVYRPVDVIQLENLSEGELQGRKLHAVSEFQIGAFKDAHKRMDKFWYLPKIKRFLTYVFAYSTASKDILWNCPADLTLGNLGPVQDLTPIEGNASKSWWSFLWPFPSQTAQRMPTFQTFWEEPFGFNGMEIRIRSPNVDPFENKPTLKKLDITLGPESMTFSEFVSEGYAREKGSKPKEEVDSPFVHKKADRIRLNFQPEFGQGREYFFNLDNEEVEMHGDLEISLLADKFVMFCGAEAQLDLKANTDSSKGKWWQQRTSPSMANLKQRL